MDEDPVIVEDSSTSPVICTFKSDPTGNYNPYIIHPTLQFHGPCQDSALEPSPDTQESDSGRRPLPTKSKKKKKFYNNASPSSSYVTGVLPLSHQQFPISHGAIGLVSPPLPPPPPPLPPPPPPPPPPFMRPFARSRASSCASSSMSTSKSASGPVKVSSPKELIPLHFSSDDDDSYLGETSIVEIVPTQQLILLTQHKAHAADFEEFAWVLQHGSTGMWHSKPSKKDLLLMNHGLQELPGVCQLQSFRQSDTRTEVTRVWASGALATPLNDDIEQCEDPTQHFYGRDSDPWCAECSEEKTKALDETRLVYCIVICTVVNPSAYSSTGESAYVYKLLKCGSRDEAAVKVFLEAGRGFETVFSCVFRLGETLSDRSGPVEKVRELWKLAEECEDKDTIRVFY